MNKAILIGRLTREPEVRYPSGENGTIIARYTLAVKRKVAREGEPDTDFFNCTAFGKAAEFAEKYLRSGTKIAIVGRLQNNNYTNREGQKVYSVQIIVEEQEFAESKNSGNQTAAPATGEIPHDENGFMNIPDGIEEDLPFA